MNNHMNNHTNNQSTHLRAIAILGVLALSATLFLAALGPGVAGQPGESPLSPVPALQWPPAPGADSRLVQAWRQVSSSSFWTSPLPWAALGLILFSAFAWALIAKLRPARSRQRARDEETSPPEWTP
jgi:hypothetical protein